MNALDCVRFSLRLVVIALASVLTVLAQPVVRIATVDPSATELPFGSLAPVDPAIFEIYRDGDLSEDLRVYYSIHGTAMNGGDYEELSTSVLIPAAQSSVRLIVTPRSDMLTVVEPLETVGIRMEYSPVLSIVPQYLLDLDKREAATVIYEFQPPSDGGLEIAIPRNGFSYAEGEKVTLLAALYATDRVASVSFYDSGKLIAAVPLPPDERSWLFFPRFEWLSAPAGQHTVTARAFTFSGVQLTSSQITFTVGDAPRPTITITAPQSGEFFSAGTTIQVDATAVDPVSYIPLVEFFADGLKIGESHLVFIVAPPPGQSLDHSIKWENVPAGSFLLTARAKTFEGQSIVSASVRIQVDAEAKLPIVSILAKPTEVGEPTPISLSPAAQFIVMRTGSFELPLRVFLNYSGTATPGLDYDPLPQSVLIPIHTNQAVFPLHPKRDLVAEGTESLIARIAAPMPTPYPDPANPLYQISSDAREATILIKDTGSFVMRKLPPAYTPGINFKVELDAVPPLASSAYAVEDRAPAGWLVYDVSNDGVFDQVSGKVKFGPFFDSTARTLVYRVTAPENATGSQEFAGAGSANGVSYPIGGDYLIEQAASWHPADRDQNSNILLDELTLYAAAWKSGDSWPVGPVPIPLNYVTRAGYIWKRGEAYKFDPTRGPAPQCWIPLLDTGPWPLDLTSTSMARFVPSSFQAGVASEVQIRVTPASGASSVALQETLPAGWSVSSISRDGTFDPKNNCIRWGPFADDVERTFTYSLTPPRHVASIGRFIGTVSVDGELMETSANARTISRPEVPIVLSRSQRLQGGGLQFKISGPVGQTGVVESSSDLKTWTSVQPIYLPDGNLVISDESPVIGTRYYRFRAE